MGKDPVKSNVILQDARTENPEGSCILVFLPGLQNAKTKTEMMSW